MPAPPPIRKRAWTWMSTLSNGVAEALVLGLVLVFAYEVTSRYLFNKPTGFADQIGAYTLPAIVFLSLAFTLRNRGHVHVDLVTSRLPAAWQARLQLITGSAELLVSATLTWYAFSTVIDSYRDGVRSFASAWSFPEYLPQVVMPVGLLLLTVELLVQVIGLGRQMRSGR